MSTMDSAVLADEALERLRKRHSGDMYDCVACYRHEPCPERELVRQYDRLLADYGQRLSVAESFERDSARLRRAIGEHRDQVTSWNIVNREPAPADEALWDVLGPEEAP